MVLADPAGSILVDYVKTGNVGTAQHVYTTPATYTVSVVATDSSGATGSATIVLVVGNFTALAAEFTISPSSGPAATTTFTFNASDSAPRETIVDYAWDFGDGTSGSGQTTTHSYAGKTAGTYTVRLTVTDNSGRTATKTHTVQIT